jgi:hypothetical protein
LSFCPTAPTSWCQRYYQRMPRTVSERMLQPMQVGLQQRSMHVEVSITGIIARYDGQAQRR